MNRQTLEKVLAQYVAFPDPQVMELLTHLGPLYLSCASLIEKLTDQEVKVTMPTTEQVHDVLQGKQTFLGLGLVEFDANAFAKCVERMGQKCVLALQYDEATSARCTAIDLTPFLTAEMVQLASTDPWEYHDRVMQFAASLQDAEVGQFLTLTFGLTVRAFLDKFANEVSAQIERTEDPVVNYDRRLTCPVCGCAASVSGVVPTPLNGNVKKLFCGTCGGHWKFERIRCAICGDSAVSDLTYIHDENDLNHRLHVCTGCHQVMPTFFAQGDENTYDPDIEGLVLTGLEQFYTDTVTGQLTPASEDNKA